MDEKRRCEDFVDEINGMYVYNHHYSFSTFQVQSLLSVVVVVISLAHIYCAVLSSLSATSSSS